MDVAIVGGGIGGLTAAIALERCGVEAHVFEAASALREIGAGIWVPTNAMLVLDRLGLAVAVQATGLPVERAEVWDYRTGPIQTMDLGGLGRRHGWATVAIERATLQRVLADRVAPDRVHTGKACRSLARAEDGVRVAFADGSDVSARVVVGADGARSTVRQALFPDRPLRYSGHTSYRALVDFSLPDDLRGATREIWGPGTRFGLSHVGKRRVYWFATLPAAAGEQDAPGTKGRLECLFGTYPSPVPELIAATEEASLIRTDMFDLPPLSSWHGDRVVLLGDAAHAPTPNLGQGGAQAIEDAWVLAEQLAAHAEPAAAFVAYERVRMRKAHTVTARSWQMGKVAQVRRPLARAARNALMRHVPAAISRRQLDALYRLNY